MKRIILTAIDDDHLFWFSNFIPFILSLKKTDYQGDIGVIAYNLSSEKQQVLKQNGCLVFNAPYKYPTIFLDRQWAAARIAEQFSYDEVALYDTDIWFPSNNLTVFDQIRDQQKLYCAYDISYGDFLDKCVKPEYKLTIQHRLKTLLTQHKSVWQVGVIIGHRQAWLQYRLYLDKLLLDNACFHIEYGIDTLAVCLYSIETDNIAVLSERYNCIPHSGRLRYSNLTQNGDYLLNSTFTLLGEPVEGLHIVGPHRIWGRHFYEYAYHNGEHFFNEGKKFRPKSADLQRMDLASIINYCEQLDYQSSPMLLRAVALLSETALNISFVNDELHITAGSGFQCILQNPLDSTIVISVAIQTVFGYCLPQGRFIAQRGKAPTIYRTDQWIEVSLEPQEKIVLCCYDLDVELTRAIWRLKNIKLV